MSTADVSKLSLKERIAYFNRMKAANASLMPTAHSAPPLCSSASSNAGAANSTAKDALPMYGATVDKENMGPSGRRLSGSTRIGPEEGRVVIGGAKKTPMNVVTMAISTPNSDEWALDTYTRPGGPRTRRSVSVASITPSLPIPLLSPLIPFGLLLSKQTSAGVLVEDVDPTGQAAAAGIRAGDVIIGINGLDVTGKDEEEIFTLLQSFIYPSDAATPAPITFTVQLPC